MVQPRSTEDDDLPPELPRLDGGVEGEENFQPKDDSDLGLSDEGGDVGLDMEAGLDEPLDGELDNIEDEPASWLDDGKEPNALGDDDGAELDGDDENLTEGSEPASDQAEDWDDDFGFDDRSGSVGDSGEEGFGDESLIGALDLDQLPPLDDGANSEEEPIEVDTFAAEAFAELSAAFDDEAGEELLVAGLRCTRIDGARVTLDALLETGQPLVRLIALGAGAVAWDGSRLLVAEPGAQRAEPRASDLGAVLALAAGQTPEGAWMAAATPAGLLCSNDLGRSFVRAQVAQGTGMPELLASLAITRTPGGATRLWAAGAAGALWASDDRARSFRCVRGDARVLRLASDGAGALAVLGRGADGGAVALRSSDGERFAVAALPVSEIERVQDLQVAGSALLCCRRAPLPQLAVARGGAWREVPGASPPAALVREGDKLRLYFWVAAERVMHLLRQAIGSDALPEIIAELPRDAGAPLQLCGHHDGGVTTLHAGTERALYRLTVRREGASR